MAPELVTPLRFDLAGLARDGRLGDHQSLMRLAERADRYGFGGIWFNEFHFHRSTLPYPHTLLLGADILARTEHLRFGTSVLVLPLHHPLMLAEQIAQLDFQSGGRVDVGVGRGTEPATFETLGIDPTTARQRFEEALRVMLQAWTSERVASDGRHGRLPKRRLVRRLHSPHIRPSMWQACPKKPSRSRRGIGSLCS